MIAWRLDHHEERLSALESRPHISHELIERIPWARLITVLAAWLLFWSGLLTKAELVKIWFGF